MEATKFFLSHFQHHTKKNVSVHFPLLIQDPQIVHSIRAVKLSLLISLSIFSELTSLRPNKLYETRSTENRAFCMIYDLTKPWPLYSEKEMS